MKWKKKVSVMFENDEYSTVTVKTKKKQKKKIGKKIMGLDFTSEHKLICIDLLKDYTNIHFVLLRK